MNKRTDHLPLLELDKTVCGLVFTQLCQIYHINWVSKQTKSFGTKFQINVVPKSSDAYITIINIWPKIVKFAKK